VCVIDPGSCTWPRYGVACRDRPSVVGFPNFLFRLCFSKFGLEFVRVGASRDS
jgi:hypothetical protein